MNQIKRIFPLLFIFLCNFIFAEEKFKISIEDAIDFALSNNSEIKRQQIVLDASLRLKKNSWNSILPSLSVSVNDAYNSAALENENEITVSGNASVNFKSDFFTSMKKSKIDYEIELLTFTELCTQIQQKVYDSYFDLLNLQNEIFFRAKTLENAKSLFLENQSKYKKGFLSENDFLTSKIVYEKQKTELKSKKRNLIELYSTFCILIGISPENEIELSSDLIELYKNQKQIFEKTHKEEILQIVENEKFLEIEILKLKKQAALKNFKAKKLELLAPSFGVSYSAERNIAERKLKNSVTAGISIQLDNFLGISKENEEIKSIEDSITDLEIQFQHQKEIVCEKIKFQFFELEEKNEDAESYKSFVDITKRNQRLCQKSYANGLTDIQSVKNALSENLEAQIEYMNCIVEILKIYSSIQKTIGNYYEISQGE